MAEKKETFEQKIAKIEEISKQLQNPKTDLEKAVSLYEEGMNLAKEVDKQLSKLERRIEIVTSSYEDDQVITQAYN